MDFTLSETDEALRDLTARILGDHTAPARLKQMEADVRSGGTGVDPGLWAALTGAGLIAAFVDRGPDRPGVVAAALMCREVGATVAPVPLASALTAVLVARDCPDPAVGDACAELAGGASWAAIAQPECGGVGARWAPVTVDAAGRLHGEVALVPDLPGATWVVVEAVAADGSAGTHWVACSSPGVVIEPTVTTAVRPAGRLTLDGAGAVPLGPVAAGHIAQTLAAASQAGVCTSAIRAAAGYLGTRHQFGRPLASFQAPVHRLVDAHIDTDAIWLTALLAAWRLDEGLDAASAVDVARWWAADAGNRAVHTVQHLHGGIGADVDYPVHRYFLWAKALGDAAGGGAAHLAHLGGLLATGAAATSHQGP